MWIAKKRAQEVDQRKKQQKKEEEMQKEEESKKQHKAEAARVCHLIHSQIRASMTFPLVRGVVRVRVQECGARPRTSRNELVCYVDCVTSMPLKQRYSNTKWNSEVCIIN